jgi:hypothetical protein
MPDPNVQQYMKHYFELELTRNRRIQTLKKTRSMTILLRRTMNLLGLTFEPDLKTWYASALVFMNTDVNLGGTTCAVAILIVP